MSIFLSLFFFILCYNAAICVFKNIEKDKLAKEIFWQDVKEKIRIVNTELADIIDRISPDSRHKLIQVNYNFGDLIVNNGSLNLLHENKLICYKDLPINMRRLLSYSEVPLSLSLDKTNEIFITEGNRTIPLYVVNAGNLLGTYETLDFIWGTSSKQIWNVAAGCRTIFTLPKINEQTGCNKLRLNYGLPSSFKIRSFLDHWATFKQIANHANFKQQWRNTIIFFTTPWFEHKTDPAWYEFERYLFKHAWLQQSKTIIDRGKFGILWQSASKKIGHRKLKPSTYISDTIKHILAITMEAAMGFTPADDSQQIAPTKELQDILLDTYGLKYYHPTIMHPAFITKQSIYYSLTMPTLLEGTPQSKQNSSTIMFDIRNIKVLLDTITRQSVGSLQMLNNLIFEYFHIEKDLYEEINSSIDICNKDNRLCPPNDRQFCSTSPFWRGCIKIGQKCDNNDHH